MQCHSCSAAIEEAEAKAVAHWHFCADCFDALMNPKVAESGSQDAAPAEEALKPVAASESFAPPSAVPSGAAAPGGRACRLCGCSLDEGQGSDYGFWVLCEDCEGKVDSISKVLAPELPEEATPELVDEPPAAPPAHAAFVPCGGCGRVVPYGGMRELNERRVCPDCFRSEVDQATGAPRLNVSVSAAMPVGRIAESPAPAAQQPPIAITATATAASAAPDRAAPDRAATDERCASCERLVGTSNLKLHSGHWLCGPCGEENLDLAIQVAAARHRVRLKALLSELGG